MPDLLVMANRAWQPVADRRLSALGFTHSTLHTTTHIINNKKSTRQIYILNFDGLSTVHLNNFSIVVSVKVKNELQGI